MSKQKHRITHGSRVTLHYAMTLPDGNEVVSTYEDETLFFTLGDGTMEAPLEEALLNLQAGDERTLEMSGDEVYGPRRQENLQWIDRSQFPKDMVLCKDLIIGFTTPDGEEVAGLVVDVEPARLQADFNHPLSGKIFLFKATIIDVEPPA
ncbi:MAG: FKBP-type peptidyl-prolyl cis-trans isomerase [Candidatus Thiodiazotropha sp. (ex Monitilora ramsayi)]|nr:FKBP-type peptidyl-prolyl cis-trans isomerase [Candidatus Thiodiazotropha sp. (ex Monitilora ramsayi)]